MKKKYEVDYDFKGSIVVELDESEQLTQLMHEVNSFWSGADERLRYEDGDIKTVFLKMLCEKCLLIAISGGWNTQGVISQIEHHEGWPHLDGRDGVKLISLSGVEFEFSDMSIAEVAA